MAALQMVIFKIGEERYGINIDYVNGIEREQKILAVPNAAECVKGIINLRGEVVPIIDVKAKFGKGFNEKENPEIIVINLRNGRMGLEVDKAYEIQDLEREDLAEMPTIAKGEGVKYFERVAKVKDELIIMVNPHKLLTDIEASNVYEIIEADLEEKAAKERAEKERLEKEKAEREAAEEAAKEAAEENASKDDNSEAAAEDK